MTTQRTALVLIALILLAAIFWPRGEPEKDASAGAQQTAAKIETKTKVHNAKPIPAANRTPSPNSKNKNPEIEKLRNKAKTSLASIFSAQRAFHAEFGRYSTDFNALGFSPVEVQQHGVLEYKIGFLNPYTPDTPTPGLSENPESMTSDTYMNVPVNITNPARDVAAYSDPAKKLSLEEFRRYCQMGCTADRDRFELLLVLPLENGQHDVWLINDKKEFVHACNGLTERC